MKNFRLSCAIAIFTGMCASNHASEIMIYNGDSDPSVVDFAGKPTKILKCSQACVNDAPVVTTEITLKDKKVYVAYRNKAQVQSYMNLKDLHRTRELPDLLPNSFDGRSKLSCSGVLELNSHGCSSGSFVSEEDSVRFIGSPHAQQIIAPDIEAAKTIEFIGQAFTFSEVRLNAPSVRIESNTSAWLERITVKACNRSDEAFNNTYLWGKVDFTFPKEQENSLRFYNTDTVFFRLRNPEILEDLQGTLN